MYRAISAPCSIFGRTGRYRKRSSLYILGLITLFLTITQWPRGYFNDLQSEISLTYKQALNSTQTSSKPDYKIPLSESFREVNERGIYTFYNVCIEPLNTPVMGFYMDLAFNETQRIVIYNRNTENEKNKVIKVSGTKRSNWNYWELHFSNRSIPTTHTFIPATAFFVVSAWCPSNLYHFWEEEFMGIFSIVHSSNRLHSGPKNQLLYRHPPLHSFYPNSTFSCHCCEDRSRYDGILRSLRIVEYHEEFYNLPSNTCFSAAIFGKRTFMKPLRTAVDHVLRYFNITYAHSTENKDWIVTILQRSHRRIINVDDVINATRSAGFERVQLVNFEDMSVWEQIAIAARSRVMVGVQGAGLQWAIFMSPGSTLVEISWPHWNSFYSSVGRYGIRFLKLVVNRAQINWRSYKIKVCGGRTLSSQEQQQILSSSQTSKSYHNLWKWADVSVNIGDYEKLLEKINSEYVHHLSEQI